MVLKPILHGQMTEKIASEVRPKKGGKLQKVPLLKSIFWPLGPLGEWKKLNHIKFKSKISYLGEKNASYLWKYSCLLKMGENPKKSEKMQFSQCTRGT